MRCIWAVFGVAAATATAGCGGTAEELGFSPAPGTPAASPKTQISIRARKAIEIRGLKVTGSHSGRHVGRLVPFPVAHGASFLPSRPFDAGESVNVQLKVDGKRRHLRFRVAEAIPTKVEAGPPGKPRNPGDVRSFRSRPDLRPTSVTVTKHSLDAARGDLFLTPSNVFGQAGPLVADARGQPVWFKPMPGRTSASNLQVQRYRDRPVLTWWQGTVLPVGYAVGRNVIADSSYRAIAHVNAGNGYEADHHDFVLTPERTALVLAYSPVKADVSSVGGPHDGQVLDCVVQELDVTTRLVLFEWHSLGSVGLDESYSKKPRKGSAWDYFHVNSVALDRDGNLLLSARNTSTVYKINRLTGHIMWRLGGKKSDFSMGRGTRFAFQHDAQRQPDDTITLFDNGADPKVKEQSRAIALKLDTKRMTATLAREWNHPEKLLAGSQGNMQTLAQGHRFVGWGAKPNMTEFSAAGRVVFDASLPTPSNSYRAFRFRWIGLPTGHPAVATTERKGGRISIYVSWNGATEVRKWRILAAPTLHAFKPLVDAPYAGFETHADAALPPRTRFIEVQALDKAGDTIGRSQPVKPGGRAS